MTMNDDTRAVVDAINDLTRVTLALHGDFGSRSEAVRRLHGLAIPAARIAAILAMPANDVRSTIAKAKKAKIPKRADGPQGADDGYGD